MVKNVQPLLKLLNEVAPNEFEMKILKNDEVKVQPKTEEKYSVITKSLIEKNAKFHTFKLKSERPFNVVLKGLHYSTAVEDIKSELENIGFDVIKVSNVKRRLSKALFSM